MIFGNQGDLWMNAMTWWDHDTGSIWSQPLGEAILGPRKGQKLELMASSLTEWGAWKEAHPETIVMRSAGWQSSLTLDQMVVVVELGDDAVAYSIPELREAGVVNDELDGTPLAVVFDPDDENRWAVFSRRLDSTVARLGFVDGALTDTVSGTTFDPFLGLGSSGPLADQNLGLLPGFTAFPSDYRNFYPEGRLWP